MRILYLATNLDAKGGIQRYCRAQIEALRDATGGQVSVLALRTSSTHAFEDPFDTDYTGRSSRLLQRPAFVLRALAAATRHRPPVVWVNHVKLAPLGLVLRRVVPGCRLVINVYGREVWSGLSAFERHALRSADRVVADCHATADHVKDCYGLADTGVDVVWDPVDVERFAPMEPSAALLERYGVPRAEGVTYLMTLGRLSRSARHKGYDRVLDLMPELPRDVAYIVAGDGDDRPRLEARARDEGVADRVSFLGSIHEDDLASIYGAGDIFALVSDKGPGRGEGVPLTPLEASACGKPVIVGDEDGSREGAVHGETGFVVSPRDPAAMRAAILALAESPERRQAMGNNARQYIVENFSYDRFATRTAAVLRTVGGGVAKQEGNDPDESGGRNGRG